MQTLLPPDRAQLPLFHDTLVVPPRLNPFLAEPLPAATLPESFSELTLNGAQDHCLHLLAPMLRELSEELDPRWLTLIAPPTLLTTTWLRSRELNLNRILLLQPRQGKQALDLACEALRSGQSHTVISWLHGMRATDKRKLALAAQTGEAQSLNIRLG
ncbi:cell division inhibitor SulA [Pseudomonas duriflava]|uniref:Cell division inhibitor SulA n=1 Tax=Pseudomonas duriflava TaxID=459528 RepID=A0A562Q9G0_9PSED|nr:SOS-induced cell division inhibitor SulA [Pseudomonas duriflava]TWI53392.1 cell division inhibitor SulA [Pseudomonas duriflava]